MTIFLDYYNSIRYYDTLGSVTPEDIYFYRREAVRKQYAMIFDRLLIEEIQSVFPRATTDF